MKDIDLVPYLHCIEKGLGATSGNCTTQAVLEFAPCIEHGGIMYQDAFLIDDRKINQYETDEKD